MNITIYSTPTCTYCDKAKKLLRTLNLTYTDHNVKDNPEYKKEMVELTGQLSVPVIVIGDTVLVGYDQDTMLTELRKRV